MTFLAIMGIWFLVVFLLTVSFKCGLEDWLENTKINGVELFGSGTPWSLLIMVWPFSIALLGIYGIGFLAVVMFDKSTDFVVSLVCPKLRARDE